jgi:anti-anti-sigma factor
MGGFTASWERGILRLTGELDLATADTLLQTSRADHRPEIVVDLAELRFIDSTGIRALIEISRDAGHRHLLIRAPSPRVRQVFDLIRLDDVPSVSVEPDEPPRLAAGA